VVGGEGRLLAPLGGGPTRREYTLDGPARNAGNSAYPEAVRTLLLIVGGLAVLAGGTFFLQGINVLPGSYMTGDTKWAWIGAALVIGGVGLVAWSRRRSAA
jgi:hypothetical protein